MIFVDEAWTIGENNVHSVLHYVFNLMTAYFNRRRRTDRGALTDGISLIDEKLPYAARA